MLLGASILGTSLFLKSKSKCPQTLFFLVLFMVWSGVTVITAFINDVSFFSWSLRFFSIFIFCMAAISTLGTLNTKKQITILYFSILIISVIALLKNLLPLAIADDLSSFRCDSFRAYSGWNYSLFVFSLGLPLLFNKHSLTKKVILYVTVGLSIFAMLISLTRTYWVGAVITIFLVGFLFAKVRKEIFYKEFIKNCAKIIFGMVLVLIFTFIIFPDNVRYCFINRISSVMHLTKDPSVLERISESKGIFDSLNKKEINSGVTAVNITNKTATATDPVNKLEVYKNILIGNGLGSKFTYILDVTGARITTERDFSHNYYAYIIWTTGLIGLILLVLSFLFYYLELRKHISYFYFDNIYFPYLIGISASLFVGVIISFVGSPLYLNEWALYYGILFGLGLKIISYRNKQKNKKVVIVHNIISPYKVYLFNALNFVLEDFTVIFIADTEKIRKWKIDRAELKFKHEILFNSNIEDINQFKLNIRLFQTLNRINPDVIIIDGYSYIYNWIGMIWGRIRQRKLVLWSSSTYLDQTKFFFKELAKKLFVSMFDVANTYSLKGKDYLVHLGMDKQKIFVTGNITDNDYYSNECEKYKNIESDIRQEFAFANHNFLYVGRFSCEKNVFVLLEAFNDLVLSDKRYDWGLVLIGDGPQEKDVITFIKEHNLTKYIKLVGFHQKQEICKFYAVCDVLVLPSLSETWGIVANEAMSCGLALVVSKQCGCYPDIVKDGVNGYSFDPNRSCELRNLLEKFTSNHAGLDELKRGSLKIIQNYTPEIAADIIKHTIEIQ